MSHTYEVVANFLKVNTTYRPEVGIICGSGLSGLSKSLENPVTFKYEDIPGFPSATVPGHAGELVFGTIGGIQTVCMRGRFHFYEGNSMEQVVLPVRVMRLLGVKLLVVTNAAGGLNPAFNVGDIVVIQDHFGLPPLAGNHPLRGVNDDALGPRFPSISDAYDERLQQMVVDAAADLNLTYKVRPDGTYCFVSGPCYESKAECRFLRSLGGDTVGMSTVPEVIAAKHCGMKILGLSLVTNKVVVGKEQTPAASHAEVLEAVEASGMHVEAIVRRVISKQVIGAYLAALPAFTYVPVANAHAAPAAACTAGVCPIACCSNKKACCAEKKCCLSPCANTVISVVALGAIVAGLFVVMKHHHQ